MRTSLFSFIALALCYTSSTVCSENGHKKSISQKKINSYETPLFFNTISSAKYHIIKKAIDTNNPFLLDLLCSNEKKQGALMRNLFTIQGFNTLNAHYNDLIKHPEKLSTSSLQRQEDLCLATAFLQNVVNTAWASNLIQQ